MKKLSILAVAVAALVGFSQTPSHAQFYSSYAYNNNAYLNYAIASQRAAATRRGSSSKARKHRKSRKHHSSSHHRARKTRKR